jgi:cell division protein FtsB
VDFQPMSPDEMQRTMQFLLNQQAKFAVDFDKSTERFDQLVGKTDRIADAMIGLTAIVGKVVSAQDENARQIDSLQASVRDLKTSVDVLKVSVARLHDTVEQHLRNDHGYPGPDAH